VASPFSPLCLSQISLCNWACMLAFSVVPLKMLMGNETEGKRAKSALVVSSGVTIISAYIACYNKLVKILVLICTSDIDIDRGVVYNANLHPNCSPSYVLYLSRNNRLDRWLAADMKRKFAEASSLNEKWRS